MKRFPACAAVVILALAFQLPVQAESQSLPVPRVLQVGAFLEPLRAEGFAETLTGLGFSAHVLTDDLVRVFVGPYCDRAAIELAQMALVGYGYGSFIPVDALVEAITGQGCPEVAEVGRIASGAEDTDRILASSPPSEAGLALTEPETNNQSFFARNASQGLEEAAREDLTGRLGGMVVDPSGARIVAATVTLIGDDVETVARTNAAGEFVFEGLASGRYRILAVAPGFTLHESSEFELEDDPQLLSIELSVIGRTDEITVSAGDGFLLDSDASASVLILRGEDLNLLPDGPGGLAAALRIMTVRTASPRGPQIRVNGFTGGRLPPKSSIREIRINQNPFSAEYSEPGAERVEILTKPGSEAFQAGLYSNLNDESLNSRNPFSLNRPPFQSRLYGGNLGGPLVRQRISFFADLERGEIDDNALVKATVVGPSFQLRPFSEAVLSSTRRTSYSGRLDFQLNPNHTLIASYERTRSRSAGAGIGELVLPSRGFNTDVLGETYRLTETALTASILNETRVQYTRDTANTTGLESSPAIEVPGSFSGGGSENDRSRNVGRRWELHNVTMWTFGAHSFRAGGDFESVRVEDHSPYNFRGTWTYAGREAPELNEINQVVLDPDGHPVLVSISNLESYRRTVLFEAMGLDPSAIRLLGGGASQFSIAGGDPVAAVEQYSGGLYFQGDWRLTPGFTLSQGLRYERQTNLQDKLNFAPRWAFAWAPGSQNMVIRGGFGIFYNRISESHTLNARRLDGLTQQQYVVTDPAVLDRFEGVPTPEGLRDFAVPSSITRVADDLKAPQLVQTSVSIERTLPGNVSVSASFMNLRTRFALRSVNVNAPRPGGGGRPLGEIGEVYQLESSARSNQNQFVLTAVSQADWFTQYATYILGEIKSDSDGPGSFPANTYDLSSEYGYSAQDARHTVYWGGWVSAFGLNFTPTLVWRSGLPFNITTGRDSNGDTRYTERPAFASDPSAPGVVVTPFGAFDLNPAPGQAVIPRNFGRGPSFLSVDLSVSRSIQLGPTGGRRGLFSPRLNFSIRADNLLNRTNPSTPIGNLSSPDFGQPSALSGDYGFGRNFGGNRRVTVQLHLGF